MYNYNEDNWIKVIALFHSSRSIDISLHFPIFNSILKSLKSFLITRKGWLGTPNLESSLNIISWLIVSKALIRSTKTTQEIISCSLRIWSNVFNEKEPSGHPVSGEAPNCTGVPSIFRICWSRKVMTKLIPLQLFGSERFPFLGMIFLFANHRLMNRY